MGPRTVCKPHRDAANLVYGWCVVWALGTFDFTLGGHIVLHEAKLIIELGPGDMIFLPSACITHENIPIQETEQRYSVTLYSAGHLFRYRDCGFRTLDATKAADKDAWKRYESEGQNRWEDGCNRFATLKDLKERWHSGLRWVGS